MTIKVCVNCQMEFLVGNWPAKKFCSNKCRIDHWKSENVPAPDPDKGSPVEKAIATKQQQLRSKTCPACGMYFDVTGLQHAKKYCNPACKMAYLRRTDWRGTYKPKHTKLDQIEAITNIPVVKDTMTELYESWSDMIDLDET